MGVGMWVGVGSGVARRGVARPQATALLHSVCNFSAVPFHAHPWTLVGFLQVRCDCVCLVLSPGRAHRAWGMRVSKLPAGQPVSDASAGVQPAARSCLDVALLC